MLKRAFDIIISGTALIILLPFLPPLALILRLTGEGEVFYIQPRMGKNGSNFGLIKLATMLKDSPNLPGGNVTLAEDPRILPLGRILRKTKLNELPQFWNIFKGEMSLVGPRPLIPASFHCYPEEMQEELKTLQPGLTGMGSLYFRDEESLFAVSKKADQEFYYEDILPYKCELEVWYKKNQNLWLDLKLIYFTVLAVLFSKKKFQRKSFKGLPVWTAAANTDRELVEHIEGAQLDCVARREVN